jgi:hypothetical protein
MTGFLRRRPPPISVSRRTAAHQRISAASITGPSTHDAPVASVLALEIVDLDDAADADPVAARHRRLERDLAGSAACAAIAATAFIMG